MAGGDWDKFMKKGWWFISVLAGYCLLGFGAPAAAAEDLPKLVKRLQPAVVKLNITKRDGRKGRASGFFINDRGHLVTNFHAVDGYARMEVETNSGRRYPVKSVLGVDRKSDLAKLEVAMPLPSPYLSVSSAAPDIGEKVIVLGSPQGLEQTLSDGLVSSHRKHPKWGEVIQITAPISPGSSGSPVMNLKGQVVGVVVGARESGQNLNFAIPGKYVLALKDRPAGPQKAPAKGY